MRLRNGLLTIDTASVDGRITRFVRDYLSTTQRPGLVMGISGGVDSAVCAAVSAKAI